MLIYDERIPIDPREEVTTEEAVPTTTLNGLGCADRPLSLTPLFFEKKFYKPF